MNTYTWIRPRLFDRRYVLRLGNEEVAGVEFERVSTTARAAWATEEWTLHRSGILEPTITVRRSGEVEEVLIARGELGGTTIVSVGSRTYHWRSTRALRGEFGWQDADGRELIRYRPRVSARSIEQIIDVVSADLPTEHERLLTLLGGYILALTYSDLATTTAIALAAAAVG